MLKWNEYYFQISLPTLFTAIKIVIRIMQKIGYFIPNFSLLIIIFNSILCPMLNKSIQKILDIRKENIDFQNRKIIIF